MSMNKMLYRNFKLIAYRFLVVALISIELIDYFFLILIKKNVVIFDIDNTIVDTEKILKENDYIFLLTNAAILLPFKIIIENLLSKNFTLIFLTARPFSDYLITKKWLSKELKSFRYHLYCSESLRNKIYFFKLTYKRVILIDDLAYGIDIGGTHYFDVLNIIQKNGKISFFGYNEINQIKNGRSWESLTSSL